MKYLYYPGCSMHSSALAYERSFKAICPFFFFKVEEVKGWTCCMPTAVHAISRLLSVAAPIANLSSVEKEGHNEVLVPCAACFSRFKQAVYDIEIEPELHKKINDIVGYKYQNKVNVLHPLELFSGKDHKGNARRDVSTLSVVCYYGCLLTRPPKIKKFPNHENPSMMDEILKDLGFRVLDWSYKTECCGATLAVTQRGLMLDLCKRILEEARLVGADLISVACPLCQMNLEMAAFMFAEKGLSMPILYFTQLLGLAYGLSALKDLGIRYHLIDPMPLLHEKGLHEGGLATCQG